MNLTIDQRFDISDVMPEDKKPTPGQQRFLDFCKDLPPLPTTILATSIPPGDPPARVVNKKHTDKWDVYIGRPSIFGNAHPIYRSCPKCSTPHQEITHKRGEAIKFYKEDFLLEVDNNPDFRKQILALRGKVLACHCKSKSGTGTCHGDVIVEWLDNHLE